MTTDNTPAEITIRYTPGDGVTLDGSTRGDGVYDVLRTLGMNWRGMRDGSGTLYIRGSRDRDIARYRAAIERTRTALEAAGRTVAVEIEDGFRTAEQRRTDADERAAERADWLRERAGKAETASDAAREASRAISDGMPFGEPIKVGHHSEARHRRAFERIDSNERKRFELADKANRLDDRAAGVESNAAHRNDPRAIMRRIEKLEADRRGYARSLAGHVRNFKRNDGSLYARDEFPAATGTRADDLRRLDARDAEEIEHLRATLAELAAAGVFSAWGPDDFQPGDLANVGGRWCKVARVNRKSVSVSARWGWEGTDSRPEPVKWDDIHGRRRDGLQWDAPHAEPWPVELARNVSRWHDLVSCARVAHQHRHGSDEWRDAQHVADAQRIVHGLPTDAPGRELAAIVDSLPTAGPAVRDRVAAYLAVWDRLHGGERAADIAATVTPIAGNPAWRLPTDREPVDRRASELVPGDLVAGFYDTGFAGSRQRLIRGWCGPVVYVSPVRDRRESGEWVTIRLADGEDREMKSWRQVAVFPAADGGAPAELVQPTPDADPAPAEPVETDAPGLSAIAPADLYRHFKVLHIPTGKAFWVLGGDARYEVTGSDLGDYRPASNGSGVLLRSGVNTHPWGWVADLSDLAVLPDGCGMYHPDHLAVVGADLAASFDGSWRQAATHGDAEAPTALHGDPVEDTPADDVTDPWADVDTEPAPAPAADPAGVVRHFQHYTAEQRANLAASHRLGPQQRRAVGEFFYTHPDVPGRSFPTRKAALRAAAAGHGDTKVDAAPYCPSEDANQVHAELASLATDLTRAGEDVHAGGVWRLARAVVASDPAAHLEPVEVLRRLREMRSPNHIRPRMERAAAAVAAITTPDPVRCVTGGTRRNPEAPDASSDTTERRTPTMLDHPNPIFLITDDDYRSLGAVEVTGGRFIGRDTAGRILFDRKDYDGALTAAKKHGRAVAAGYYGLTVTGEGRDPHPCAPCNMRRKMADDADRATRNKAGCSHGAEGWCRSCSDAAQEARRQREAAAPIAIGACVCVSSRGTAAAAVAAITTPDPVRCVTGEDRPEVDNRPVGGPKPTVVHNDKVYKLRSRKTEIPDLSAMDSIAAAMWLLRNTYPTGTNHRQPAPNLPGLNVVVR